MRLRGLAGSVLGVALLVCSAPSASGGHDSDPLAAGVWLDPSAPSAGSTVAGSRAISGHAHVPEGVRTVSLYVVPTGRPVDLVADEPMDSVTPGALLGLGLGEVRFSLNWEPDPRDSAVVDLHVVAATAMRDVGTAVTGVRVAPARSARAPLRSRPEPAGSTGAPAPAVADPVVAQRRALSDGGVYLGGFEAALPYQRTRSQADSRPRVVTARPAATSGAPRAGWLSAALGLMLVVGTAHMHRLLRPHAAPPRPRGSS